MLRTVMVSAIAMGWGPGADEHAEAWLDELAAIVDGDDSLRALLLAIVTHDRFARLDPLSSA